MFVEAKKDFLQTTCAINKIKLRFVQCSVWILLYMADFLLSKASKAT